MKVYIWGTGISAHGVSLVLHNDVELIGYIDNNVERQGQEYFRKRVFSPEILQSEDYDYIIISARLRYREISEQLENMGIDVNKIIQFFNFTRLMPLAFFYNETCINEEQYQDVFKNYVNARIY